MSEIDLKEQKSIEFCFKQIEEKLQWGKYENISDHNFKQLSDDIKNISGITIDAKKLKTVFEQKDCRLSENMKKGFSKYLGFSDWEDLQENAKKTKGIFIFKSWFIILGLLLLLLFLIFAVVYLPDII